MSRVGPVAYQLALPPNLKIHNVFHISILKKYVHDAIHVIDWNVVFFFRLRESETRAGLVLA